MSDFLAGLLLLLTGVGAPPLLGQVSEPEGQLGQLRSQTGWIVLGELTEDRQSWATGHDPIVDFPTGPFAFVDRDVDRRLPTLPRTGERIRILGQSVPLYILDYATRREARRLTPPSAATRPRDTRDRVGFRLPVGTVLVVQDLQLEPLGRFYRVWARVVPSTQSSEPRQQ